MDNCTLEHWTLADRAAAGREGWDLFECFDSDHGPVQLQALADGPDGWPDDQPPPFGDNGDDDQAWVHVLRHARDGSPLHIKALTVLATENPAELERITRLANESGES